MFGGANLQSANANSNNLFAGSYTNNNADITVNADTNPNPTDNSSPTNLFSTHNNISTSHTANNNVTNKYNNLDTDVNGNSSNNQSELLKNRHINNIINLLLLIVTKMGKLNNIF